MKLTKQLLLLFCLGFALVSCGDDEECEGKTCPAGQELNADCDCVSTSGNAANEVDVTANITSDRTWSNDSIYILKTRIAVTAGNTLTIEPGTIIKGEAGAEANATALLIARGAMINAEGNRATPIIFTSVADDIQPGMIESPNLASSVNGLWGGLIILGNAPISADASAVQIEGIPPSDQNGLYGGTEFNDNSGILKYVSIRHGGSDIGEGNEINGLTLGGVGAGTTVEYVEVISNVDDGIEFFGGSVNAKNCLVWNQGDDAFDCDQAWTGTLDGFVYIAGANSDHGLELDGPEGTTAGTFTLKNGSLKGGVGEYCDLRSDVRVNLENIFFFNFSESSDVEFDNNKVSQNYLNDLITLNNLQFNTAHLADGNRTVDDIFQEKVATDDNGNETQSKLDIFNTKPLGASIITTENPTVGADIAEFRGWTLADAKGELADF